MTVLASLLAAAAVLVLLAGGQLARTRLRGLGYRVGLARPAGSGHRHSDRRATPRRSGARARWGASALSGLGLAVLLGGPVGVLAAVGVAIGLERMLARLEPRAVRERRDQLRHDLPAAADLLAACVRAGQPVPAALAAVARATPGPLGTELATVAAALRLGADADHAWAGFLGEPVLAAFGRAMVRAWDSGAPLAATLDRVAEDSRRARRAAAEERARAVGVRAAAPLGLCFLPAFLLIGVVPVIVSAAAELLSF